jgi:hypothetical protein
MLPFIVSGGTNLSKRGEKTTSKLEKVHEESLSHKDRK